MEREGGREGGKKRGREGGREGGKEGGEENMEEGGGEKEGGKSEGETNSYKECSMLTLSVTKSNSKDRSWTSSNQVMLDYAQCDY